ncbi:acyltransferase [Parabacteroides pacaensis]|uniref:acyltransferase n=1 Tax=Parabacteroides pacaensis TaxID=2086575 RepID=UPI00131DE006|nr:acyltransferase [Parabacteroides pacaensis]
MKGTKRNLKIGRAINIAFPINMEVGDNVVINAGCSFVSSPKGPIKIGNDVSIAPQCYFQTQNHNYRNRNELIKNQGVSQKGITIGNDVWIAYSCTILPGVTISDGCVIGANSVVTKDTLPYSINVGHPAKYISYRE